MSDKDICPVCRFPKRISGCVFINKNKTNYLWLEEQRCKLCKHLPDYAIISINPKIAEIIYRNFNGSKEYFEEVKNYLKEKGFDVVNVGEDEQYE